MIRWRLYDEQGRELALGHADAEMFPASVPMIEVGQTIILDGGPNGITDEGPIRSAAEAQHEPYMPAVTAAAPERAAAQPRDPTEQETLLSRLDRLEALLDARWPHGTSAVEHAVSAPSVSADANWRALLGWTNPDLWTLVGEAGERKRMHDLLSMLHEQVQRASRGERVLMPGEIPDGPPPVSM